MFDLESQVKQTCRKHSLVGPAARSWMM